MIGLTRFGRGVWARLSLPGLLMLVALAACMPTEDNPVPTVAQLDTLPTAIFLTENAPPAGFSTVHFDPIDAYLTDLNGWAYRVSGEFTGTFAASGDPAAGAFAIRVWGNELAEARRVTFEVEGEALAPDAVGRRLEGVRLSNDYYTVDTNGVCTHGGDSAAIIADLSAGQIIGGVATAVPTGFHKEIEGIPAWNYTFDPEQARLPAIREAADGAVDLQAALWIAPEYNAVLLYELRLVVEDARILWADEAVSGTLRLRYELEPDALREPPNISIPHGC